MPSPNPSAPAVPTTPVTASGVSDAASPVQAFVERRGSGERRRAANGKRTGLERRQFGSSHQGLSEEGRELAQAIDRYKMENHRRYITCDEMLQIMRELGYQRLESRTPESESAASGQFT